VKKAVLTISHQGVPGNRSTSDVGGGAHGELWWIVDGCAEVADTIVAYNFLISAQGIRGCIDVESRCRVENERKKCTETKEGTKLDAKLRFSKRRGVAR